MVFKKIKHLTLSKSAIVALSSIASIFLVLYLGFLFILPNCVDINSYLPMIKDELSKYTKLEFNLENPKLQTTWDLSLKLSADKISLDYSKGKNFANLDNFYIKVDLPTLIFKHLNLDKIYIGRADVNLVFDKNKKYTIFDYLIEQKKSDEEQEQAELPLEIRNINLNINEANISLYDENISSKYILQMNDNKIKLKSLEGPILLESKGKLEEVGAKKNKTLVDFNLNLESVFPKNEDNNNKQNAKFKLIDYNPLVSLSKFNFYTNLETKLKISDLSDNFKAKGYVKINDTTIRVKSTQLPKSSIDIMFDNDKIESNANLYITKEEFVEAKAKVKTGKNPKIDINTKSDKISLDNIKSLSGAILDMLNIQNDFKNITAGGYLTCNFNLIGDSKKIKSSGSAEVKNGFLKYTKAGINLTNIASILDFSNNKLSIKNTNATLNGAKLSLDGEILTNSEININVKSDPIKIPSVIKLAQELKLINQKDIADYAFSDGTLSLNVNLTGKFDNIIPDAKIKISNFLMTIKSLKMPIRIASLDASAKQNGKDFIVNGNITSFKTSMDYPKMNIDALKSTFVMNSQKITLNNTPFTIDGAKSSIKGEIENYMTKPQFSFVMSGNIAPKTIITMVPKENRSLIKYSGQLPYNANVSGDLNNIKITAKSDTSPKNYISVVDVETIKGLKNTLNADMLLSGQTLNLNDISINSGSSKVMSVKGVISSIYAKNPIIKSLQVSMPRQLSITAPAFGNLKMHILGNLNVSGSVSNPILNGNTHITSLSYPAFNLSITDLKLDFKKALIDATAQGVKVGDSDFNLIAQASSNFAKGININSITLNAGTLNADSLLKIASKMPNTQTTPGPSASGITIKTGRVTVSRATFSNLLATAASFDFNLKNNLLSIQNLKSSAYGGSITGSASYQIAQLRAKTNLSINNLNVTQFSKSLSGVIIPVSGVMNGAANLSFKGSELNAQLKSLSGKATFEVENGELKEFIKLENFLHANNLLSQNIFGVSLNSILSAVSSKNTGKFKKLDGVISFANGWGTIESFKTQGYNMSLNVKGKYNILTNYADLRVLGRISASVASAMGPLSKYSLGQTVDNLASKNDTVSTIVQIAKTIAPTNSLWQSATAEELATIPPLATAGVETKEFMAVIQGLSTKTTSVKVFKWIGTK